MLRLSQLPQVNQASFVRDELLRDIGRIRQGSIQLTLGDHKIEDDRLFEELRPIIESLLISRLIEVNAALVRLNVDVVR